MKDYWKSLDEYYDPEAFKKNEARIEIDSKRILADKDSETSRRDFLKVFGFSIGAAVVAASCKRPVDKAIPYLIQPEEVTPGKANYYASTYFDANEYCSVLVKVRDGRPIKIEGNDLSPISQRGTSARVQASILNLYDDSRFISPLKNGTESTWETVDSEITEKLNALKENNRKVVLLTSTIISPSAKQVVSEFIKLNPNVEWIQYDAIPASGILKANSISFGKAFIPDYRFEKAKTVVSFNADFLCSWLSPVEYTKRYTSARKLDNGQKEMLRHYQIESGLSLTGSNADVRFPVKPSEEGAVIATLYNELLKAKGLPAVDVPPCNIDITALIPELLENEGKSIIISGSNDFHIQLIVNSINNLLRNFGNTIDLDSPLMTRQALDEDFEKFSGSLLSGQFAGLLCWGVNPVYDHPEGEKIKEAIAKLGLSVSFSEKPDETAAACQYICPQANYLESWGDAEPKAGFYSLAQPCIHKLFDSRQVEESLLKWIGKNTDYHQYIMDYWEKTLFPKQKKYTDFRMFWDDSLQNGVFEAAHTDSGLTYSGQGVEEALASMKPVQNGWEVQFYENTAIGNGKHANNPWLQELPDPIAKISWDNFAAVPIEWAKENGLKNESVITVNGVELPVFIQPGQTNSTISVALGYGREISGKVGNGVGRNMFRMISVKNKTREFYLAGVDIRTTEKTYPLALSQTHYSMEGRPIVREATLEQYLANPEAGNEMHEELDKDNITLYNKEVFPSHHWGMAVDLNSCTGCGNCAIACQAENNIQVVGKDQVRKRRIMHWIRVDRYFSDEPENPQVSHQPVMCQQCDNAPCENVCPVAATTHSKEGLNMMTYNRCIGTRYCINNCPYRVRRFNWFRYVNNDKFDFNANTDLGRMVLNPDVTVRSRGVVEKCTFCVQRIQDVKQQAKLDGRRIEDGEIQPACVQSCPGNALIFGDLNNPESKVSKLLRSKRNYHLLENLHTLPSVGYLTKIRNKLS